LVFDIQISSDLVQSINNTLFRLLLRLRRITMTKLRKKETALNLQSIRHCEAVIF